MCPPWMEAEAEEESKIVSVWKNVQELKRQRDGLKELFPLEPEKYDAQFEEVVFALATELREFIRCP